MESSKQVETSLYRKAFENTPSPIALLDKDFNFIFVNTAYAGAYNRNTSEFGDKNFFIIHTSFRYKTSFREVLITKSTCTSTEDQIIQIDQENDQPTYWSWSLVPVFNEESDIEMLVFSMSNLTRLFLKKQQQKLSVDRFRSIFEHSMDAILLTKPDGSILEANQEACLMFGYSVEEIRKLGRDRLIANDHRLKHHLQMRQLKGETRGEITGIHSNGSLFPIEVSTRIFNDHQGQQFTSMIIRDITTRKRTEERLVLSRQRFKNSFKYAPIGMALVGLDGKWLQVNKSLCQMLGYSENELLSLTFQDLTYEADLDTDLAFARKLITGEIHSYQMEKRYYHKQGHLIWAQLNGSVVRNSNNSPTYFIAQIQDITGRKESEKALRLSEERFNKAFHLNPNLMFISSLEDGTYVTVNDAFVKITGYSREQLIGTSSLSLNIWSKPEERANFVILLKKQNYVHNFEMVFTTISGELRNGLVSAEKIDIDGKLYMLGSVADITNRKKLEKEMKRLDRLDLIGQMAAGISHEVRNPMTTVRGFLQILSEKNNHASYANYYSLMIEELDRANHIISEFLSLSKSHNNGFDRLNINTITENIFPLIQAHAIEEEKNVILELGEIPELSLDEKEIRQLILNLSRNGLEAMPPGRFITIRTHLENSEVILEVRDQGSGIKKEIIETIGTPFLTTKEYGTGLGLSICYSIAARHGAKLDFKTGPEGSTFYVRFPANDKTKA